jgi:hypothetical protein
MYRANVKPWRSVGWKPQEKHFSHAHANAGTPEEKPVDTRTENGMYACVTR